ncbi:MAG: hypothetical protein M9962_05990 [Oligoflexia bacterium]|nr:hypothetical protein [Oligoflexia bacterium]
MEKKDTKVVFLLFSSVIFLILFYTSFSSINRSFPYYFFWDMDRYVTLDVLLMQEGKIPTTLHHTGFGTYFLLSWSQKIAHWWGVISILDYSDIRYSLNPLLGTAEVTDYFRAHEPLLCTLLVLVLWLSVICIFSLNTWQSLILLVFLGTQRSLYLQASFIRTELYSVFYWSLALLSLSISLKRNKDLAKALLITFAGVFMGLSYLTKVQSLVYILIAPVLYLLLQNFVKTDINYEWKISRKNFMRLAGLNFVFFFLLVVGAYLRRPMGSTYASSYPLNGIGVAAVLLPAFLYILEISWLEKSSFCKKWLKFWPSCRFIHFIASGVGLSFFLHFLTPVTWGNAFRYLFLDAKMLFFRKPFEDTIRVASLPSEMVRKIIYNEWPLLLNGILLIFVLVLSKNKKIKLYSLTLVGLAYVYILFGTRGIVRDQFWNEIIFGLLSVVFSAILWSGGAKKWVKIASCLALSLLMIANIFSAKHSKDSMKTIFAHYCCQLDKNFISMHNDVGLNTGSFSEIMKEKFSQTFQQLNGVLLQQSVNHLNVLETTRSVFPNSNVNLKNVGILIENMPVWNDRPTTVLKRIPAELKNSIVVDATNAMPSGLWIHRKGGTMHTEDIEAVSTSKKVDNIGVMTRIDLQIFAVTDKFEAESKPYEYWNPTGYKLELGNEKESKVYSVFEIQNYDEYDSSQLKDVFWIIVRKYAI